MNEIIKSLHQRKSVRVFTEEDLSKEDKNSILSAALQAPSAGCQLLYTILDITEQGKKERLAVLCDNQPFIAKAKLVLVFCADCRKWLSFYKEAGLEPRKPGAGDLLLAVEDALIAAQNAVTAAESLGIGSCYIGDVMENAEEMKNLLQLPRYVYPACMLVFGHPTQQQKERKKPERFRISDIVCENSYRDKSSQEIREMFSGKTGTKSYDEWMEAFWKRKYESDFSKEMSRSMEVYLKDYEETLYFDNECFEVKKCELEGSEITYRAFEGIDYCTNPADPIQKLNLFVPEAYYQGETINGYTLSTAPILIPNTVGGYMPGPADGPGRDFKGQVNVAFRALEHGYVVVCPGIRGRTSGMKSNEFFVGGKVDSTEEETGKYVGKAPALIVDMKAVVRYLRHNKGVVPGNVEQIITSGTSAGGALSALAGATGNSADYEPYLTAIGAAKERDDIFAANCYCPIHNLEHADAAYEWLFSGCKEYHGWAFKKEDGEVQRRQVTGELTEKQLALSAELKKSFSAYVNSLELKDKEGNVLTLEESGEGSFKEYVRSCVLKSAQKELDTHDSAIRLHALAVPGSEVEKQSCLTIEDGCAKALDWDCFVKTITRMKKVPAFDALDLKSPENEEFGTEEIPAKHFTDFSWKNSEAGGELADEKVVRMLNPTAYIKKADTAEHWRIRHGAFDRDTSLAIPVILAVLLENHGCDVDFALPWGLPHSGDYDLEELFMWIDGICKV